MPQSSRAVSVAICFAASIACAAYTSTEEKSGGLAGFLALVFSVVFAVLLLRELAGSLSLQRILEYLTPSDLESTSEGDFE